MLNNNKMQNNIIKPYKSGEKWIFDYKNKKESLNPPDIINASLSPDTSGMDSLVTMSIELKGLSEKNLEIIFSDRDFIEADIRLEKYKKFFDGDIYYIHNLGDPPKLDIPKNRKIWLCPIIKNYFKTSPYNIFASIRNCNNNCIDNGWNSIFGH